MKLEFVPEMFKLMNGESTNSERSAKEANEILNKWLKNATAVYRRDLYWGERKRDTDTHKALLIKIEPIVKEPCSYHFDSVITISGKYQYWEGKCELCGAEVKMVAK